jgi:uncharacterized protein
MLRWWWFFGCVLALVPLAGAGQGLDRQPVIDVHLHAMSLDALRDQGPFPAAGEPPFQSTREHAQATLDAMVRNNIVLGIVGGAPAELGEFREAGGARVWASAAVGSPGIDPAELRRAYRAGELRAMGEVLAQYEGLSPSDPDLEPYFALAAELDIPVGIHTGLSFPGVTRSKPAFRVALGNPIHCEELLNRHPDMRVYLMHAGWPFLAETIGVLNVYPQVYVDIGVVSWIIPREEFYAYLRALIRAGLLDRIMFGSDQMSWPAAIDLAIEAVKSADFLSDADKRAILYANAARFLRLSAEEQAAHHAMVEQSKHR